MHWLTALSLTSGYAGVGTARRFVCVNLAAHQLVYLQDRIELVVSELVTNALMHAQPPVILSMQEQELSVLVTVSDSSPALPNVRPHTVTGSSGRGLSIVHQVTDAWGANSRLDGGKSVWARFDKKGRDGDGWRSTSSVGALP